jgi:tetratricopeptide (TPR) repeat protein
MTRLSSERTESLKLLAHALMTAYGVSHSEASVLEAVSIYEEILRLQPPGHQDRTEALSHLGDATFWLCLYHAAGDDRRAQCVALLRETLHLRPPGHSLRDQSLHNLARALCFVSYEQQSGGLDGLIECVQLNRDALELRPAEHSERANSLNNLGCALSNLFECRGDPDVLAEAIEVHSLALQLRPEGHPLRDGSLNNLAYTLRMSFEHFGGFQTLSDAITLLRESLQLRPAGHPMHAVALDNLASLAYLRSSVQGLPESLSEAVLLWRKSCQAMSADSPLIGRTMTNLAEALIATHRQDHSPSSLAEAMLLLRQALNLLSPGDHRRHESLECLAKALIASFDEHGDRTQLAEAESLLREVLQSRSRGHHDRLRSLQTLGNLLCKPESRSWEEAHVLYGEALVTCPRGSPARSQLLSDMSQIFLDPESPLFDLGTGLSHLSDGYSDSCSHVHQRLASANLDLQRVEAAYMTTPKTKVSSNSVLALYAQVIGLLPRLANFGLDHCMRLRTLSATDGIARTAASRALILGRAVQAVEMLEEGRSVFWSQSLHLRSTELDDVPDNDRQELERLLCTLDIAACRLGYFEKTEAQRERDLEERRRLNEQAEALISKIRGYPGLERFLLPPSFDSLLQALPDGFVVIVNSSKLGHHALLLHRLKGLAATLELRPSYTQFDVEQLRTQLPRDVHALIESHFAPITRAMRVHRGKTASLDNVLASMWDCVVRPIISALGLEVSSF